MVNINMTQGAAGQGEAAGSPERPFPALVGAEFADFFAGLARRQLTVRQCVTCGTVQWPPRPLCARCHEDAFGPFVIGDRGVVHTFTVCYRAFDPWFAARLPYAVVVADLGTGIRLTGSYLGDDLGALRCGLPVRARYVTDGGHPTLGWVPADAAPEDAPVSGRETR
jgi:uncharacterized OB-fold protein